MKKFKKLLLIFSVIPMMLLSSCETKYHYSAVIEDKFITYKHNGKAKEFVFVLKEYGEHLVIEYDFNKYKIGDTYYWGVYYG